MPRGGQAWPGENWCPPKGAGGRPHMEPCALCSTPGLLLPVGEPCSHSRL